MKPASWLVIAALAGCASVRQIRADLAEADRLVVDTRKLHGDACAPKDFAVAEAEASFARIELEEGDGLRAAQHASAAVAYARTAWTATESCGQVDSDGDGVPDVVDQCPDQAEDIDGEADDDGCRDIDPYADSDKDRIRNIDDDCPDDPEDFDGHNDSDGCPETSEDTDGDSVIDALDQCPDQAEDVDSFQDLDGCPDDDNDRDGLPDHRDKCPSTAEDLDDWLDDDGCPEDDNDSDGVRDADDACPNGPGAMENRGCPAADRDRDGVGDLADVCPGEAETVNGWLDMDGCPDSASTLIKVTPTRIELLRPVAFVESSAELDPATLPTLDDVARALRELGATRVRIEGHTDAQGDEGANLVLSRRRAEIVFDYLVGKGVPAERMDVAGFGGTQPIDTNRTESGRVANRRIEFFLVR